MEAILARFQGITVANGYMTDIGNSTYLCRAVDPDVTELPFLNILDLDRQTKEVGMGQLATHEHTLTIAAQLMVAGSQPAVTIRQVEADLSKAIGEDRKWITTDFPLGIGFYTVLTKSGFGQDANGVRILGGYHFEFTVKYRTKAFDETKQPGQ